MDNIGKVLITGVGSPGGPGIIKSLLKNDIYIVGADINEHASGRFLCNDFILVPKPNEKDFVNYILNVCKEKNVKYIIPLVTKELYVFSEFINFFYENNIKILVSEPLALSILNDKKNLSNLCKKIGVPTPDFETFNSSEELIDYIRSTSKKLVVKPSYGNGSRGIRVLDNEFDNFNSLFNDKPNNMIINKNQYIDIIKNKEIPELMVCEYLPGDEITVDCIVNENNIVTLIRKRTEMRDGISIAGEFIIDEDIENYVHLILKQLPGVYGPIGFQFKKSENGVYKILESNPRLQGTSVAAAALDYNYPYQCLRLLSCNSFTPPLIREGYSFRRYYSEVFYESK